MWSGHIISSHSHIRNHMYTKNWWTIQFRFFHEKSLSIYVATLNSCYYLILFYFYIFGLTCFGDFDFWRAKNCQRFSNVCHLHHYLARKLPRDGYVSSTDKRKHVLSFCPPMLCLIHACKIRITTKLPQNCSTV